jgi:UDP-2,3-diacylglucosamine hydrolase
MIYFVSDIHLGAGSRAEARRTERAFCRWLDHISTDATALYLLGDIFDFWFEYRNVVPKGYTRFLGKLSELTDRGVEVHFFIGNHDIWCKDYLAEECGVIMHYEPFTVEIEGKLFYLAHGDGLGDNDRKFMFLRGMFHNPILQRLFACIHPRWSVDFGLEWAKHSRLKHEREGAPRYMGEQNEPLIVYSKEYLKSHPDINYFIYGHRHIELDLMLARESRLLIIGEWTDLCTYAVFDGKEVRMENFIEGESIV